MRFRFPFPLYSVPEPASASTTTVVVSTPSRWGNISGAVQTWNKHVPHLMPRFEHVRWGLGRQEWNGGMLSGQLNYVIDSESGFIISENAIAVIASENTLNA